MGDIDRRLQGPNRWPLVARLQDCRMGSPQPQAWTHLEAAPGHAETHLSASAGQAMLLPTWTPTTFLTSTAPGVGALVTRQCP